MKKPLHILKMIFFFFGKSWVILLTAFGTAYQATLKEHGGKYAYLLDNFLAGAMKRHPTSQEIIKQITFPKTTISPLV